MLAAIIKPQAHESFLVQQFFKNAAEVWASSPHLRSKLHLQLVFPAAIAFFETYQLAIWFFLWNKLQIQTRQRGNCSTLVDKSRGGTPFCRTWKTVFPKRSVFNHEPQANKSFLVQQFYKNAAKVWASSPHLRSKLDFAICFSCCNCIFWNLPIRNFMIFMKQVANSDKATGQLQHAGRQKQGWNPLLPDAEDRFL